MTDKIKVLPSNINLVLNGVDESLLAPLSDLEKIAYRRKFSSGYNRIVISIHARIPEIKNQLSVAKARSQLSIKVPKRLVLYSDETGGALFE